MPSTAEELLYWIVQPLWKEIHGGPAADGFGKFFTRPGMSRSESRVARRGGGCTRRRAERWSLSRIKSRRRPLPVPFIS